MLTIGSLFSGIGGLELGLEWAGLGPVLWQVEKDEFCRRVLAKHWPDVPRWNDVETVRAAQLPNVDLICGGFPCQDVSAAGKRIGLTGKRSGLWWNFVRLVADATPTWVVVENVASGASKWLRPIRHHLHMLGYRTRALGIAARDVGAPHRRSRVFVVAYNGSVHWQLQQRRRSGARGADPSDVGGDGQARPTPNTEGQRGRPRRTTGPQESAGRPDIAGSAAADAMSSGREGAGPGAHEERRRLAAGSWWASEPDMDRVVYGLPGGLDGRKRRSRLRAQGNAVVPQCAQVVGEVIRQMLAATARPT